MTPIEPTIEQRVDSSPAGIGDTTSAVLNPPPVELTAEEVQRQPGETDDSYASRIQELLLTKQGIAQGAKPPDPDQWGPEARAARGAVGVAEQPTPAEVEAQKADIEANGPVNQDGTPEALDEGHPLYTAHDIAVMTAEQTTAQEQTP